MGRARLPVAALPTALLNPLGLPVGQRIELRGPIGLRMTAPALGKMSGITVPPTPGGIVLHGDPAAPLLGVAAGISFLVFLALDCN